LKFFDGIKNSLVELYPDLKKKVKPYMNRPHLILAAAGILFIYSFLSGAAGFIRIAELRFERSRLQKENQQLLAELVDCEITKKRLQNDDLFIEYIARTRHYLSRPGETIYRFKE